MKKRMRWVGLGMIPLTAAVIAGVVWNPLGHSAPTGSFNVMSAAQAQELKAALLQGKADPDATRPTTNREGSPSSAFEQYLQERAYPANGVPADAYTKGFNAYSLMDKGGNASFNWNELGPLSTPNGSTWGPADPGKISGRATAIAVDPATCSGGSCKTIYLGTAGGGVWKTTDGGQSWTPLTEGQSALAVGAITLDPADAQTIYVGTGEPNNAIDNNRGQGILKSTNGGRSWTTLGFSTFVNRAVADVVVDPTNHNLYAITYIGRSGGSGTTYGSGTNNPYLPPVGFYRSTDGGATWTLSNPTSTLNKDGTGRSGTTSLVRGSDGTLYLAVYNQGIYSSTNGGQSWTALPNSGETVFDRITLAVAPTSPSVVYAAYSHDIDGPGGMTFYASSNGGATWTKRVNTPSICSGQCWYDMPVAVSPSDPNKVYMGGVFNYDGLAACPPAYPYSTSCSTVVMKSLDGGATWYDIGDSTTGVNVHPDDHVVLPTAQGGLFTANDGGLYHSADDGGSWQDLNNGLGTLQFQGVSANSQGDVFGGTQDNGTWMLPNGSSNGVHIQGGDGGMTAADPNNPNIVFDEYYGTQLQRFDKSNGSQTWMAGWWCDYFCFGLGQFYQPMALGTQTPTGASASNDVFSGSYRVWRSLTGGGVDANHDGDATNDPGDTTDFVPITPNVGNISVIAVSPTNPNVVAFATTTGTIYYTTNALAPVTLINSCATHHGDLIAAYCRAAHVNPAWSGQQVCSQPWLNAYDTSSFCEYGSGVNWTRLDVDGSNNKLTPNRVVTDLAFAPGSTTKLYATFSGFDENTPGYAGHVFVTRNAGATSGTTWSNITGADMKAIPDIPANAVVVTPRGNLIVAADFGVFYSKDDGQSWQRVDKNLANSPVYDLALSPDGKTVYAATHGRGIWSASVPAA